METAPVRLAHARLANAIKHKRAPAEVAAARREYDRAKLAADVWTILTKYGDVMTDPERGAMVLVLNAADRGVRATVAAAASGTE